MYEERVGDHSPGKDFVPARILRAVGVRGSLIHRVTNTDTAVRVHSSEAIVLVQLSLNEGIHTGTISIMRVAQLWQ